MYTSATNRPQRGPNLRKTTRVYLALSAACVAFDRIYALFAHGVSSASMSLLFLYPLLGGFLPFFLLWRYPPRSAQQPGRLPFNCWNSGLAALAAGSLLRGIMQIAGTSSPLLVAFPALGWSLILLGLVSQAVLLRRRARFRPGGPGSAF